MNCKITNISVLIAFFTQFCLLEAGPIFSVNFPDGYIPSGSIESCFDELLPIAEGNIQYGEIVRTFESPEVILDQMKSSINEQAKAYGRTISGPTVNIDSVLQYEDFAKKMCATIGQLKSKDHLISTELNDQAFSCLYAMAYTLWVIKAHKANTVLPSSNEFMTEIVIPDRTTYMAAAHKRINEAANPLLGVHVPDYYTLHGSIENCFDKLLPIAEGNLQDDEFVDAPGSTEDILNDIKDSVNQQAKEYERSIGFSIVSDEPSIDYEKFARSSCTIIGSLANKGALNSNKLNDLAFSCVYAMAYTLWIEKSHSIDNLMPNFHEPTVELKIPDRTTYVAAAHKRIAEASGVLPEKRIFHLILERD